MTNAPTPAGMAELRDAITLILPLAKGYAAAHPVGSNQSYVDYVETLIAAQPSAGAEPGRIRSEDHLFDLIAGGLFDHPHKAAPETAVRLLADDLWAMIVTHPAPVLTVCQACGGEVQGWACQGCGQTFSEVDGKLIATPVQPDSGGAVEALREALERIKEAGTHTEARRIGDAYSDNGWDEIEVISEEAKIATEALAALRTEPTGETGGAL